MPRPKKSDSLTEAVSAELKANFSLEKFKEKKMLNGNVKFKEQKWIPVSEAVQEALGVPGIPMGHITLLRGHSNAGKTTSLIEAAVSAQKSGILPVFIITEMKWSWEHLKQMGFKLEDIKDEQGNIEIDIKRYAKIEKIPGGVLEECEVLNGVMFNKDITHPNMRRRIENPRIILLDCPLEYKKGESMTAMEFTKEEDFKKALEMEETEVLRMCENILRLKPDVVITEKGVSDIAQHFLLK
jgi:hypothetical protein